MLTRQTVIWAKRETTYGTDPAMTGTDGVLAYDVDINIQGEQLERPVLRDTLSPLAHIIGLRECELTFKTEMKGIGLPAGTVANLASFEMDDLLSGCGFDTGVTSGSSTLYSLTSNDNTMNSCSFYVHLGDSSAGNRHKITGARGSVKFNLEAGKYGIAEWNFKGIYNAVISATLPSLVGVSSVLPQPVYNSSFQIGGFSPVCSKAEIDLGVDVVRRDSLNAVSGVHSFRIGGRKPKMTFNADAVVESSNPFWGDWDGSITDTFSVLIGTNLNNKLQLSGYFEYIQPKYGDADGVRIYDLEAALVSSNTATGNDEFQIRVA